MSGPSPPVGHAESQQGGVHAPDLGELGVVEVSPEFGYRRPGLAEERDDGGERADLAGGHRTRRGDPRLSQRQTHEGPVLQLGAQGQHRAGRALSQAQQAKQPSARGEPEGVAVHDLDVHRRGARRAAVATVPGVVRVHRLEPHQWHAGCDERIGDHQARRPGRGRAESEPEGEADGPAEEQRAEDGQGRAGAREERRHSGGPDHHERKGSDPFAPDDVGNREQRHHRDDDRVQRVGAALGERTGQGKDHVAQTTVEDERAQPEHDEGRHAGCCERMDELHRPAADQEIGSDGQRQDDDADAGEPADELEEDAGQAARREGEVLLQRPRRAHRHVGEDERGSEDEEDDTQLQRVGGSTHAIRDRRFEHLEWSLRAGHQHHPAPVAAPGPAVYPRVVCRWACSPPTRRRALGREPTQRHTPTAWRLPRAHGTVRLRGVTRPDS